MDIRCHENPHIDSVFHVPINNDLKEYDCYFFGAPSIHEHIILNNGCAKITFELNGKSYSHEGHIICGKFTVAPKIKINFIDPNKPLTIIRISPCSLYRLFNTPVGLIVNNVVPGDNFGIDNGVCDHISQFIDHIDAVSSEKPNDPAHNLTREIIDYINKNFDQLPPNSALSIAETFGISDSTLRRYFKKYLGVTPSTYLITIKRKKMIRALYENKYHTLRIQENGYYDQAHFLNDFKRLYSIPLKQYITDLNRMKEQAPELMDFFYHCNIAIDL